MSKSYTGRKKLISLAAAALIAGNVALAATVDNGGTFNAGSWDADTNITVKDSTGGSVNFYLNDTNDTLDIDAGYNGKAILDWTKLNVLSGNTLNFDGTNAVYLNKVTGNDVSNILGTIGGSTSATVIIVNPNGIVLGNGANIEINDIAFSTDDVTTYNGIEIDNNASNIGSDLDLYGGVVVNSDPSNIVVESGASITSSGKVVFENSNGNIEINSSISNATDIIISGGSGANLTLDENGSLNASDSIDIDVEGNVTLNADMGTASGGGIYIGAGGNIITQNNAKISTANLEVDADGNVAVSTSVDNLQVDNANAIVVSNDTNLTLSSINVNTDVSITAVGTITADAAINAENVTLNASGNDIGTSDNAVEVNAGHLTLIAGNAYIKSSQDVNITKADITTNLYINAEGQIVTQNQDNNVTAGTLNVTADTVDLEKTDADTIIVSGNDVTVNNQKALSGESEFNAGSLNLTADGAIGSSTNAVDLNASVINIVSNGNDIYFNLTGDTRTGTVNSGGTGDLVVAGNGYDLGSGGENNVHINVNSITVDGAKNVALYDDASSELKNINISGDFEYHTDGDLALENNISAADITLYANSVNQTANNLTTVGSIYIYADNNVDLASVSAYSLTVTSTDGNVTLGGVNVKEAYLNADDAVNGTLTLNNNGVLGVNAQSADLTVGGASQFNLGSSRVTDTYKLTTDANVTTVDRTDNNAIVTAGTLEINNTSAAPGSVYLDTDIDNLKVTNIGTVTIDNHNVNLPADLEINSTDSVLTDVNVTADSLSFAELDNNLSIEGTYDSVDLTNVNGTVNLSDNTSVNVYDNNKTLVLTGGNIDGKVNFEYGINDINVTGELTADNFNIYTDKNVSLGDAVLENSISLDNSDLGNIKANIFVYGDNNNNDVNVSNVNIGDYNLSITGIGNLYSGNGMDVTANTLTVITNSDINLDTNVSNVNFVGNNIILNNSRDLNIFVMQAGSPNNPTNVILFDGNITINNGDYSVTGGYESSSNDIAANTLKVTASDLNITNSEISNADLNVTGDVYMQNNADLNLTGSYNYNSFTLDNLGHTLTIENDLNASGDVNLNNIGDIALNGSINAADVNITSNNNITLGNSDSGFDLNATEVSNIHAANLYIDAGENNITTNDVMEFNNTVTNVHLNGANIYFESNATFNNVYLDAPENYIEGNVTSDAMTVTDGNMFVYYGNSLTTPELYLDGNFSATGDTNISNITGDIGYISLLDNKNNLTIQDNSGDLDIKNAGVRADGYTLDINTTGNLNISNTLEADSVNLTANSIHDYESRNVDVRTDNLTLNAGDINITYAPSGTEGTVNVYGGENLLNIDSDGNYTLNLNNAFDASISGDSVTVDNKTERDGNLNLTTDVNSLTVENYYDSNVTVNEADDIALNYIVGNDVNITAGGNITVNESQTVSANNDLLLNAKEGNITVLGSVSSNQGNVALNAGGDITLESDADQAGSIQINRGDGNITLTAGGNIYLNSSVWAAEGVLTLNADNLITTDSTNTNSAVVAKEINATLQNEGNVTLYGVFGKVTLNNVRDNATIKDYDDSGNDYDVNVTVNDAAPASLYIEANNTDITYNTSGDVNIEAALDGTLNLNADGNTNITTFGNLTLGNIDINDKNLSINSENSLNAALTLNNTINADTFTVNMSGALTQSGGWINANTADINASTIGTEGSYVKISAPEISLISTAENSAVYLEANNSVDISSLILSGTGSDKVLAVKVDNGNLTVGSAAFDENTSVDLTANNITFGSDITAKDVKLDANTSSLELTGMNVVNNVNVTNSGDVTVGGNIVSEGNATITAYNSNIDLKANITANTITLTTDPDAGAGTEIAGSITAATGTVIHSTATNGIGLNLTAHTIGTEGNDINYTSDSDGSGQNVNITLGYLNETSGLYFDSNITTPAFDPTAIDAGWIIINKTNNIMLPFDESVYSDETNLINKGNLEFNATALNSIKYISVAQNAQDIAELQQDVADLYNKYDELKAELGDMFDSNNTVSKYISYMIWGTDNNITTADVNEYFANPISLSGLNTSLNSEIARATSAENNLSGAIANEVTRATSAETNITSRIATDENLTQQAFDAVDQRITDVNGSLTAEVTRAKEAESELNTTIGEVNTTLTGRIATDEDNFNNTVRSVTLRINDVNGSLTAEIARATSAENNLSGAIANEVTRATSAEANITSRIATDENLTQQAFDAVDQRIADVNNTLTGRIAADEEEANETKAYFENVTSELNTTLQYNVARVNAMADYELNGTAVSFTDYESNTSIFSDPNLVIELKDVVDATNAKANDEALGSVQKDTDTLQEEQNTGSLFVDFFKKLFGGS